VPCREFHGQLANPKGKVAKLLREFVCVRVEDMTNVDIGLFEFDPDSTLYCFLINAEEQIYMRYGGRDDSDAEKFLNLESLEIALEKGLALHKQYLGGTLPKAERPAAKAPADYPEVKNGPIAKKQCVHCHQLGAGKTKLLQSQGKLDRMKDLWVYPEVKRVGFELDPAKGLVVSDVDGAAKDAGLKKKDEIVRLEGKTVHTYGDLQEALDKHPADSKTLKLAVKRKDGEVDVEIALDKWWRVTDISRRSVLHAAEPFPEFWNKPLDEATRAKVGLKDGEFGGEVTKFWVKTNAQAAGLQVGDIVYGVDDVTTSEYTSNPVVWIKLNKNAGDQITLKVWRGGKKLDVTFTLKAKPW
jgi:serine protease Do